MNVRSVFDFNFPAEALQEGLEICKGIGSDMVGLEGYLDYEVLQNAKQPGHLVVSTLWVDQAACDAVLSRYRHDAKIKRTTELMGASSPGFVGTLLPKRHR